MHAPQLNLSATRALVACALLLASSCVSAGMPTNISKSEMALIPAYCRDAQTFGYGDAYYNTSPNAPKWVAMMGKGFWAIHHYCWALINLTRAERPSTPPVIRKGLREGAIGDMNYVLEHTTPDFILLPEIYTKIGEVQLLLKNPAAARDAYSKASALKPDYWPAYSQWAEYLESAGNKAQARAVVEDGLAHAPSSQTLRRMYAELGGDPASIRPQGSATAAEKSGGSVLK